MNLTGAVFIGGPPCGGKTRVADALAKNERFLAYHADDVLLSKDICTEDQPNMWALKEKNWDFIWREPGSKRFQFWLDYYREAFLLASREISGMHDVGTVVAEGECLLPEFIVEYDVKNVIYLLPTTDFFERKLREKYDFFRYIWSMSDFELVFANIIETMNELNEYVGTEAKKAGFPAIMVDGKQEIGVNINLVSDMIQSITPR